MLLKNINLFKNTNKKTGTRNRNQNFNSKQMLQRLPIALAQVKAINAPENLLK